MRKEPKTHQVKGDNQKDWIDISESESWYYENRIGFEVREKPEGVKLEKACKEVKNK